MEKRGPVIELSEATTADDYAAARVLFLEYANRLGVDLCFQGFSQELERLPDMYGPPGGCLMVARDAGVAVACVGVRRFAERTCEMKRLFVAERARGLGLGRQLAVAAVGAARHLGYGRMVLDTLDDMAAARHIYASLGFVEADAYYTNPLPGVHFMSLDLAPAEHTP